MKKQIVCKKKELLLIILYIIISLPMIYSIYNSVPASDDFAAATRPGGPGVFKQSLLHGFGMWVTWGGRWLSQFVQTLVNPLNAHVHLGRIYGIYMIVLFVITTLMIVHGLKVCVERVLGKDNKYVTLVTFIIMTIFSTTYYYSECYNWYVGAMVYTIPLGFIMVAVAAMIRYEDSSEISKKYYILMIAAGVFPATIEYCDVALGITYVYFIYYCNLKKRLTEDIKAKLKTCLPLLVYVVLGVSSVFAPGNRVRQEYYGLDLSITKSFIQFIKDVVIRIQDLIVDHPLAVILFLILLLIGVYSNNEHKKVEHIPEIIVLFVIIIFGSLYPYIYGRAFETTYLDIRMEYILDFCLHVGIGIFMVMLGRYLNYRFEIDICIKDKLIIVLIMFVFTYASLIQNYAYLDIVQIDIIRNKGLIAESYNYWDDVLKEIENSPADEVIIERDYVPAWSRYFLGVGIDSGEVYNADSNKIYDEELIMPNVYYGKKSIQMKIEE